MTGWIFEMFDGTRPPPPAVATLGFELQAHDAQRREIEATCQAVPEFLNSMGNVQGGFLAAMLDAAMGAALAVTLGAGEFGPTLEIKINYLRPVPAGLVRIRGRVVHRGGRTAFLAGEILAGEILDGGILGGTGELATTATATARVVRTGGGQAGGGRAG